jgi:hypothetical protein
MGYWWSDDWEEETESSQLYYITLSHCHFVLHRSQLGLNPGLHDEKLSSVQLCSLLNLIETSEKGFVTVVAVRYQKRGSN